MAATERSGFSTPPSLDAALAVPPLRLADEFGGGRVLLSDMRLAFIVMNRARHLAITRLLGPLPPDQENLVTLVAVLALAETAHKKIQPWLVGPALPSFGDGLLTGASLREGLFGVAGSPSRDAPFAGGLLAIAIIGGASAPAAYRSLRAMRGFSHRAATRFHGRYGYLVDPGHWRQRRAVRRISRNGHNAPV